MIGKWIPGLWVDTEKNTLYNAYPLALQMHSLRLRQEKVSP